IFARHRNRHPSAPHSGRLPLRALHLRLPAHRSPPRVPFRHSLHPLKHNKKIADSKAVSWFPPFGFFIEPERFPAHSAQHSSSTLVGCQHGQWFALANYFLACQARLEDGKLARFPSITVALFILPDTVFL